MGELKFTVNDKKILLDKNEYPLVLNDCIEQDVMSLSVVGNCVQDGVPSPDEPVEIRGVGDRTRNLLDVNEWVETQSSTKYIKVEDNKMYVRGGPIVLRDSKMIDWIKNNIKPDTDYTFCFKKNSDSNINGQIRLYYVVDDTTYRVDMCGANKTLSVFNLSETVLNNLSHIYFYGANDDTSYIYDIQILEGTYTADTMPEYEPYGYRIPIECTGTNLYSFDRLGKFRSYYLFDLKVNTTYTVSIKLRDGYSLPSGCAVGFIMGGYTGNVGAVWVVYNGVIKKNIVITSSKALYTESDGKRFGFGVYVSSKDDLKQIDEALEINLIEGSYTSATMPPYEPYYHDSVNVYTDKPLYGMDGYGDMVTFDFNKKKAIRTENIRELHCDGNGKNPNGVYRVTDNVVRFSYSLFDEVVDYGIKNCPMLSNMLVLFPNYFLADIECIFFHISLETHIYFSLNKSRIGYENGDDKTTLIAKCKAYLSEHPLIAYYVLKEPKTTDISHLIDWDKMLHLQQGTNILSATTEVQPSGIIARHYVNKKQHKIE